MRMKKSITPIIALALTTLFAIKTQAQQPVLSSLEIVDKVEVNAERTYMQSSATALNIDLSSAMAKLGATDITAADIYTVEYDDETELTKDQLVNQTNNYDSEAVGWWYDELYDDETETWTGQCAAAQFYEGSTTIYIRDYALTDNQLTLFVGHEKTGTFAGSTYTAPLYIVSGNKAVEVDVKVIIAEGGQSLNVADNQVIGEKTFNLEIHYNGSWRYVTADIPADSLLELVPQEVPFSSQWYEDYYALSLFALESEGVLTNNATANYGGFWFNADGYTTDYYTDPSFFVEPDYYEGLSNLHIGIYPNYAAIGSTVSTTLYVWGHDLYAVKINLDILPQVTMNDCEVIDSLTYTIEMQTTPDGAGAYSQTEDLAGAINLTELIESELGLENTTFVALSYIPGQGYQNMSGAYQISVNSGIENAPYMGYQMMNLDYFVQQTGNNSFAHIVAPFNVLPILTAAYAVGYDNGKISFWQKDGTYKDGDYFTAKFVVYNTDAEKRINLDVTVVYVDQLNPKVTIVEETDLTLPKANAEGSDYAATTFDLQTVGETLGAENTDDIKWLAYNALGQLLGTFTFDDIYGYSFDDNGLVTDAEGDDATFTIGYADGEFHTFVKNGTANTDYKASIVAYYGDKAYKFNITLSDSPANAIECITAVRVENNTVTYDLSGRIVKNPTRGLFIQNGKKMLIK